MHGVVTPCPAERESYRVQLGFVPLVYCFAAEVQERVRQPQAILAGPVCGRATRVR